MQLHRFSFMNNPRDRIVKTPPVDGGDRSRVSIRAHRWRALSGQDRKMANCTKVNYARESLCDYPNADKARISHAITLVLPSPLRRVVPLYRSSILVLCPPSNFPT